VPDSVPQQKVETSISDIGLFLELGLVEAFNGKDTFEPQEGWRPIINAAVEIRANNYFLDGDGRRHLELLVSSLEANLNSVVKILREASSETSIRGGTEQSRLDNLVKAIEHAKLDFAEGANEYYSLIKSLNPSIVNYGRMQVGDVFKDNKNSQIINRSTLENTLNKIRNRSDNEVASFLDELATTDEQSGSKDAGELLDQFNEELAKPDHRKSLLKRSWNGLVELLPSVAKIAGATAAPTKLVG